MVIRVEDAPVIRNGIDTSLPVVINIDEKATAVAEEYTTESILKSVIFTNGQSIGEKSNMATCYRNKVSDNEKLLKMWNDFVNIICIINAKEIDSAKTQVRVRTPKHIQKYARPFPYFMRYAKSYYKGLKNFNTAMSNMNCLCYDIERWQEALLSKRPKDADRDFDHRIYMDNSVEIDGDTLSKLKSVYNEYRDFISAKKSLKKIKKNQWVQREVNKKKKERDNSDESKLFRYFNRLYNYERGMETEKKEYKNKYAELKHKCEKIVPDVYKRHYVRCPIGGLRKPVPLRWKDSYDGCRDVIIKDSEPQCPHCGEMPYSYEQCVFCGQRFVQDGKTEEMSQPPEEERMDCLFCGGKETMKGYRAKINGHFHGKCEKCGAVVMS